jgi:hypothetical protein
MYYIHTLIYINMYEYTVFIYSLVDGHVGCLHSISLHTCQQGWNKHGHADISVV